MTDIKPTTNNEYIQSFVKENITPDPNLAFTYTIEVRHKIPQSLSHSYCDSITNECLDILLYSGIKIHSFYTSL